MMRGRPPRRLAKWWAAFTFRARMRKVNRARLLAMQEIADALRAHNDGLQVQRDADDWALRMKVRAQYSFIPLVRPTFDQIIRVDVL